MSSTYSSWVRQLEGLINSHQGQSAQELFLTATPEDQAKYQSDGLATSLWVSYLKSLTGPGPNCWEAGLVVSFFRHLGIDLSRAPQPDGVTYLMMAASRGKAGYQIGKVMLGYGVNPNAQDIHGETALHYLARNPESNFGLLAVLTEAGAELNLCNQRRQSFREFLRDGEQYNQARAITDPMFARPTDLLKAVSHGYYYRVKSLVKTDMKNAINHPGQMGLTALHLAVVAGNLSLISLLLRYGADVSAKDEQGKTPRDYAQSNTDILALLG